jgi:hypothetical protein
MGSNDPLTTQVGKLEQHEIFDGALIFRPQYHFSFHILTALVSMHGGTSRRKMLLESDDPCVGVV